MKKSTCVAPSQEFGGSAMVISELVVLWVSLKTSRNVGNRDRFVLFPGEIQTVKDRQQEVVTTWVSKFLAGDWDKFCGPSGN